ncbi:hypothetical protein CDAR_415311 [Caerostris darwini]|uniref:Uncharacterized protein n=1 Tax=Caerostris darwini TaxID=1538125 RepID=A0AAV4MKU9_9ARAC|nr:hypothetical protein CDAR_415311 [Caerostris darwini]
MGSVQTSSPKTDSWFTFDRSVCHGCPIDSLNAFHLPLNSLPAPTPWKAPVPTESVGVVPPTLGTYALTINF